MQKKIPERKCTGCGEKRPKKELVRIVKTPQDDIVLDVTGKLSGRGAYICNNPECLKKARKAKRIENSLSCQIPDEVYEKLQEKLENV